MLVIFVKKETSEMKIETKSEEGNRLEFELAGVSTAFANAVRRYAVCGVRTLAIDEVVFYENTSTFFDEYLSHRIGLIPIETPSGLPDSAEVSFYLDATGPKIVYSGDLETKDKDAKVARGKIPIATLLEGQAIRLEAKAILGSSRQHAKYQPGLAAYENADGTFKFVVESFSQMAPRELVLRAAAVLGDDVAEATKALEKEAKKKK